MGDEPVADAHDDSGPNEPGPEPGVDIGPAIEAILMVATESIPTEVLAAVVDQPADVVRSVCEGLASGYVAQRRGFELAEVAGGWRLQSHPDQAGYVERFVLDGQSSRLSAAALETLAIVAYKQPISRAQIAAIRGVGVDGVVRTLEQRGYIAEIARDPGPGSAVLFGTTALFLDKLGLASLADLPPVAAFVPDAGVVEQLEQGLRPVAPRVGDSAGPPGDDGPHSAQSPHGPDQE